MCQFVTNFISYVCAKYYLKLFTVRKVIAKIKRVNLLLRETQCIFRISRSSLYIKVIRSTSS